MRIQDMSVPKIVPNNTVKAAMIRVLTMPSSKKLWYRAMSCPMVSINSMNFMGNPPQCIAGLRRRNGEARETVGKTRRAFRQSRRSCQNDSFSMRSNAVLRRSMPTVQAIRKCPAPLTPKGVPGLTRICALSNRALQNCFSSNPVFSMPGKR